MKKRSSRKTVTKTTKKPHAYSATEAKREPLAPFTGPINYGTDPDGTIRTAPEPQYSVSKPCLSGALIQVDGDWVDDSGYYAYTNAAAICP
jgi:hypothetical protein